MDAAQSLSNGAFKLPPKDLPLPPSKHDCVVLQTSRLGHWDLELIVQSDVIPNLTQSRNQTHRFRRQQAVGTVPRGHIGCAGQ